MYSTTVAKTKIAAEQKGIISGEGILHSKTKPLPSAVYLSPFSTADLQRFCRAAKLMLCLVACGNRAYKEEKKYPAVSPLPQQLTMTDKAR